MPTYQGTPNADNINGSSADDTFSGGGGDDVIFGFEGDDLFYWSTGHGGPHNATIEDSDGADFVNGGAGTDRFVVFADYSIIVSGRNSYTNLLRHSLDAAPDGSARFTASQDWKEYGYIPPISGTSTTVVTLREVEQLSFHAIQTYDEHGYPATYTGDNSITVGDLRTTALTGLLVFDLGAGDDLLDAGASYNRIAALGGVGQDELIGGAADDELQGGADNDMLTGGGGSNTLIGGTGNDKYYSDNRFDSVIELAGEGSDILYTNAGYYVLKENVEELRFTGTGIFIGIGNAGANAIEGGAGHDYLIGLEGNDALFGHGGPNELQGGFGNDTYYVEDAGDTITEFVDEGGDTVVTALASYTLRANVENLIFHGTPTALNWTGNGADNFIAGGGESDTLMGLGGNDVLVGGGGNANVLRGGLGDDTYQVSQATDQIVEFAGEGMDRVELSATGYTLADQVENLIVVTASNAVVRGNGGANQLTGGAGRDNLAGDAGDDVLNGGSNHDFLSGDGGNDVLNGGLGADEMSGGGGADRFVLADYDLKDLVHDFSRTDGDKVDVAALLASVGYAGGAQAFADGYLLISAIHAYGSAGVPATLLQFDPDGSAGSAAAVDLAVFTGSETAVAPADFIFV